MMSDLNRRNARPLYLQVHDLLKEAIITQSVDILPTERALVANYGVSRVTVRKALEALAGAGLIVRRRKVGTIVKR